MRTPIITVIHGADGPEVAFSDQINAHTDTVALTTNAEPTAEDCGDGKYGDAELIAVFVSGLVLGALILGD